MPASITIRQPEFTYEFGVSAALFSSLRSTRQFETPGSAWLQFLERMILEHPANEVVPAVEQIFAELPFFSTQWRFTQAFADWFNDQEAKKWGGCRYLLDSRGVFIDSLGEDPDMRDDGVPPAIFSPGVIYRHWWLNGGPTGMTAILQNVNGSIAALEYFELVHQVTTQDDINLFSGLSKVDWIAVNPAAWLDPGETTENEDLAFRLGDQWVKREFEMDWKVSFENTN